MPKGNKKQNSTKNIEDYIFNFLLFLANLFIEVGEATKLILLLPFNVLFNTYKLVTKFLRKFFRSLNTYISQKQRYLSKLIVSLKGFFTKNKSKFKLKFKFKLRIPKVKFVLPKKISFKVPKFKLKRKLHLRSFLFGILVAIIVFSILNTYRFVKELPSPTNIGKTNYSLSTHIYDRNEKLLYNIYRDQNRTPVKIETLPKYVYEASIATEDKDFFRHNGISPIGGIIRALKDNVITGNLQGGSTITQQLVKSALLTPERTIRRKIKEIILALWTERIYSKGEILQMYLNQVPYGGSSYGIEEASKTYFKKSAKDLSLPEAALLAGLPQAPSLYSPYANPDLARTRRNNVLKNMMDEKYITEDQYKKAVSSSVKVSSPQTTIKAPHFVFYVKNQLVDEFGIRKAEEGGFNVKTSLDIELQQDIENILEEEIDKIRNLNVSNGAVLVTKPSTGEILAMVGSVDYFSDTDGAFNVTTALRQPGSSIKPLMYSLALEGSYTAATMVDDTPVVFDIPGSKPYKPVNYDGKFHGRIPLRYALANSYNVPAVKVLNSVGVDNFVNHAREMGITTWNDSSRFGLSLTLGGGEVKMVDMARAFGVFANQGLRQDLSPILNVKNSSEDVIFERSNYSKRVLDPGVSFIISDILSDNTARSYAFGRGSSLEIPGYKVAVKTGTTDDKKDNWTIGYTPEYLVTVWVGNNNNSPMNPFLTSGITGASPIWNRVMSLLLTKYSTRNTWLEKPVNVSEKLCYGGRIEYFVSGTDKVDCSRAPIVSITPTPTPAP